MSETKQTEQKVTEELIEKLKKDAAYAQATAERAVKDLETFRKRSKSHTPQKKEEQPTTTETHDHEHTESPPPSTPKLDGHEEGKPHFVGSWQKFCPTCGIPNPDFKDETKCKDCGTHLGAFETANKLKACPNCGGHRAERI